MVLTSSRILMRKSSNLENMSPHARRASIKAGRKISQSITRHSSSRIRARATGGARVWLHKEDPLPTPPATPSIDVPELPNVQPPHIDPTPLTGTIQEKAMQIIVDHPNVLAPPPVPQFGIIRRTALTWIDPALQHVPVQYIRDNLAQVHRGPKYVQLTHYLVFSFTNDNLLRMQRVCMGIRAPNLPQNMIPAAMNVNAWNLDSQMPTHMLAVYPMFREGGRPSVTLYPIHDIIFAAYCARWPQCPRSVVEPPAVTGGEIQLPVVRIPLPSPEAFPLLAYYLYTKPPSVVTKNLLPHIDAALLSGLTPEQWKPEVFGAMLASMCTLDALVDRAQFMLGFRANLLALGISEGRLWMELCGAWNVVRIAIQHKVPQAA